MDEKKSAGKSVPGGFFALDDEFVYLLPDIVD